MKIKTQIGNLMNVKAGHIVHGCNAQGVMGSGVALGVKNTWPEAFQAYIEQHEKDRLHLGTAYPVLVAPTLMVWNAITQNLYGTGQRLTNYEAVATCFEQVNEAIRVFGNNDMTFRVSPEVHIPLIGAARGGGNWSIISTIIEETMDYPVTLWLPDSTVTTL